MSSHRQSSRLKSAFISRSILCCILAAALFFPACSIKKIAVNSFADALGSGDGSAFTSESDLELVEGALPFSLKTMEALLEKTPRHTGLCLSLAQGYMLYGYAFCELKADEVKDLDFARYQLQRDRAKLFYQRAHGYARRGLELSSPGYAKACAANSIEAAQLVKDKASVPYLYWSGAALAKWITLAKTDPAAAARLPEAAACMQRALELDPDYDNGSIQEFFISYEARGAIMGGDAKKAVEYFKKAEARAAGKKLSPWLTYVEAVSIPGQNKNEFDAYIQKILAFNLDSCPENRLVNAIARKRAQYLLQKKDDLFLGE
jgi:predicted anti-sigma-YlaC factor YlaD